jgi:hypothetical protein
VVVLSTLVEVAAVVVATVVLVIRKGDAVGDPVTAIVGDWDGLEVLVGFGVIGALVRALDGAIVDAPPTSSPEQTSTTELHSPPKNLEQHSTDDGRM